MKYVVLNDKNPSILATLFEGIDYSGESQDLPIGSYGKDQLIINKISSIKLQEHATFIIFENADGSGESLMLNESIADLQDSLTFSPQACVLFSHVSFYKNDILEKTLFIGKYPIEDLSNFDNFVIPESLDVFICTKDTETGERQALSTGKHSISELSSANGDSIEINLIGIVQTRDGDKELTSEELLMAVGGTEELTGCGANACPAQACAANTCPAQACPANACVVNVIPVIGLI